MVDVMQKVLKSEKTVAEVYLEDDGSQYLQRLVNYIDDRKQDARRFTTTTVTKCLDKYLGKSSYFSSHWSNSVGWIKN